MSKVTQQLGAYETPLGLNHLSLVCFELNNALP